MAKNYDVKLIGTWPSPFVTRVRIALNLKSIEYEFLKESFEGKSELLLLQSNHIHKKIPVLIQEGKPICESLILVEYVDEAWSSGPSLLPSDPSDRAIAQFWAAYIDEKWWPAMKGIASAKDEEQRKALIEQVGQGLALLEDAYGKISNGNAFFGGYQIGYLDIAFGAFLARLRVVEIINGVKLLDEAKIPGLVKWAETFSSDPAVKDVCLKQRSWLSLPEFLLPKSEGPLKLSYVLAIK